ncbi:hypothetical protein [Ruminiclostridium josui]|uniref:hypothetical protein n=1 Tax=Ruminiclostridium josui TaxID=1499 RepID=UPI000466508B|nr:hypothetical protein [Ruminiclostridium josui]
MIKVIKGTVKVNGKSFKPGQIISSLSEEDEAALLSLKVAEPWGMVKAHQEDEKVETDPDDINQDKEDPCDKVSDIVSSVPTNDELVGNKPEIDTEEEQKDEEPELQPEAQPELEPVKNEGTVSIKFDAEAYVGGSDTKKQKGVKK